MGRYGRVVTAWFGRAGAAPSRLLVDGRWLACITATSQPFHVVRQGALGSVGNGGRGSARAVTASGGVLFRATEQALVVGRHADGSLRSLPARPVYAVDHRTWQRVAADVPEGVEAVLDETAWRGIQPARPVRAAGPVSHAALAAWAAEAYRSLGAEVTVGPRVAGVKADLLLRWPHSTNGPAQQVVEVKAAGRPVSSSVVVQVAGIVRRLEDAGQAAQGVVVAASGYTSPATDSAGALDIELITASQLAARVDRARKRPDLARFCERHHLRKLAFFGSVLRHDYHVDSDTDVLVEFDPGHVPGLIGLARMERELSALLGGGQVDLRTAQDLSPRFREQVLAAAEVQYARP